MLVLGGVLVPEGVDVPLSCWQPVTAPTSRPNNAIKVQILFICKEHLPKPVLGQALFYGSFPFGPREKTAEVQASEISDGADSFG